MSEALVAAIIAAVGTGTTAIVNADTARKARHTAQDAANAAAAKQAADAKRADAEKLTASKEMTPEQKQAIEAKIASARASGDSGLSPEFYSSLVQSDFPQFDKATIDRVISDTMKGTG